MGCKAESIRSLSLVKRGTSGGIYSICIFNFIDVNSFESLGGSQSHYTSFSVPIRDLILNLGKKNQRSGRRFVPYQLEDLNYLMKKFPPSEILGHGITCDPTEVVRLIIEGKSLSQAAGLMKLSKATVAASFRRWYIKARELQAAPSRFSDIEPSE